MNESKQAAPRLANEAKRLAKKAISAHRPIFLGEYPPSGGEERDAKEAIGALNAAIDRLAAMAAGGVDARDSHRLDWLRDNLFLHRWNAVIGPGWKNDWHVVPHYRHIHLSDKSGNAGGDFRAAIDAAIAAVKE